MKDKTILYSLALLFAAASLVMARQFFFPAIYQGADDDAAVLHKYVPQFVESFRQGILYPRWMPEDFSGYGSPTFVFYSPLLYFLSALLNMSGIDLVLTKALLEYLRLYVGGVFLFMLVREGHGTRAGLASALLYTLLPGRVMDLYYINSPAARFAQAFMPMALFFTRRYVNRPFSRLSLAGVALSYAAVVLSHLATAYIFTPFLFLYGIFGAARRAYARTTLLMLAALGTGLLLSSFFFVPVLFERGEIQMRLLDRFLGGCYFLFGPADPRIPEDARSLNSLVAGAVAVEAGLLAMGFFLLKRRSDYSIGGETRFYLAAVILCLFMMSFISAPLWKYVPGLETIVFSSRFESINLLFVCASLGVITPTLMSIMRRPWPHAALGLALIAGILAYDARTVARSVPFKKTEAVSMASHAALFPEYLPKAVDRGALFTLKQDDPRLSSNDEYSAFIERWDSIDRVFAVDSPRGARLRVKTFYFPGWRAWVDGAEVPLTAQEKTGAILMDVPPGRHEVALKFTNTPPRTIGAIISLLTLAALAFPYRRRNGQAHT